MKSEEDSNEIIIDPVSANDCDEINILPPHLLNPSDKLYEKPEKLQNRIRLIESIKEKIDDDKLFICLDIEAYERNHDYLTEFGWCLFRKKGEPIKQKHLIVEEYQGLRNGRYVPDNKDNYNFGKSEVKRLEDIYKELKDDFDKVNYLVGHGINNDIRFLKKIKVDVSKFKKMNNGNKIDNYGIIETMDLYSGFFRTKPVGLEKSLKRLEIDYKNLHNAGNDAHYTMEVFLEIINRFDFLSNREYEQIMNYKPPKKMKSNNNKNNKATGNVANNNNNANVINSNGMNLESDQVKNENVILSNEVDNHMNIVNVNSNHLNNGNNKNYNKNNRSPNNNSNNKDNGGGNNSNRKITKKNSQRHNNNRNYRNMNKRKSYGHMRANGNGNNNGIGYSNNNNYNNNNPEV